MARSTLKKRKKGTSAGKLRIADHWNAISIIASSQANPLKAVAEFVENSIDARARHIVITRGKKKGEFYLKVSDNGEGIPRDEKGLPDFRHVATHICDSVKRRLKAKGAEGIQGEFGIGLLSFWTVGQNLLRGRWKHIRDDHGQERTGILGSQETCIDPLRGNKPDGISSVAGAADLDR
jgi:hypothetical protein